MVSNHHLVAECEILQAGAFIEGYCFVLVFVLVAVCDFHFFLNLQGFFNPPKR